MALVPGAASADQDGASGEADGFGVGEIVVTAQKREERLSDVPLSVTAASGDQLAALGIADTTQLAKLVPGFSFQQSNYGTPVLSIRGVGFIDNSVTAGPTVTTYVDQVPLPFTVMTRGAGLDIERVEVLKGPQGTLFGQNSTGGAINYIAARPTTALKAGIDLGYGRYNEVIAGAYISGPLSDTLRARVAVRQESMDGWQRSVTRPGDTLGRKRFYNGRLLVDWEPTDTLSFGLNISGWQDQSDMPASQLVRVAPQGFLNPRTQPLIENLAANSPVPTNLRDADWDAGRDYARNDRFYLVSLRGDLALSDTITLTSLTSYTHMRTDRPMDVDGSAITNFVYTDQSALLKSFSQELRLSGDVDAIRWMVGVNYQRQTANEYQTLEHAGSQGTLDLTNLEPFFGPELGKIYLFKDSVYINEQRPITKSAFASLEYTIADQITVRASGRYTDEKRRFAGCLADAGSETDADFDAIRDPFALLSTALSGTPTTIAPNECVTLNDATLKPALVESALNEDNFAWRAGVDWKPNTDSLLYLTVARGYKSGGYTVVPAILASQIAPVTQESLLSYEAGFKVALADRAVQISGALFHYDYTDKQFTGYVDTPFGRLPKLVNIPKSRVRGAELEAVLRPAEGLRISGGVSYIDSQVREDPELAIDPLGNVISFVGDRFPNTPKWQGVADAEYSLPVGDALSVSFGGSLTFRTGSNANFGALPEFEIPSYALLDVRAGIEGDGGVWRIQAYGRNITDKWYWHNVGATTDTIVRAPAMGATYGIVLSYRY